MISSVTPTAGSPDGGTLVTLTGSNFIQPSAVRFGPILATSFTVVSATQITAVAPPGNGTVQITVTTQGGTSNGASYSYAGAPALTGISPTTGPASGGTVVTLTGTNLLGATAVRFGAANATSFTVVSATQITAVAPPGSGTVQVTVTGPGGTSNGLAYSYVPAPVPVLSGVSPGQGPAAGGNTVTLSGSGFTGASAVRFGSASASFTVVSATQITAVAPPGSGTVQVTVTGPGGTSNGLAYSYVSAPVPALTSVSPGQGPLVGGNTVTLTGSDLTGVTGVTFGSAPATSFIVVSATQITAVAPPGAAGPVQITVTGPGGTSNGVTYFYVGVPTLTGAVPALGPLTGGTTVVLTGTNLLGATAVRFGATPAASFTVVSATQITAVAPPGSGTAQITVVTPGGTSNGVPYTYVVVPVLTSLSPTQGPLNAGTTVTLFGSGLTMTSTVLFGTTPTSFTVVSDTWVTAIAPSGPAGPVNVRVTTPGGTSNSLVYTRVAGPGI
ncbi:IPT/TIG domain-containing protein [Streptomyces sp. PSAA01]|uniref:IPT/TIG domain-containing protein n=1 Tax=Streptomyces sp. PSAA01 TaxID=2912762 RepID=UPI001F191C71|nr:IPT/TIG domain-containing protein [Streptomyces sp. PSAA01]MCG0286557.1 IPT/TIG domain-containing protein [Streptomyces sp. PSAA01]